MTPKNDDLAQIWVPNNFSLNLFPIDRQVVMTNRGEAFRLNNLWFKWHGVIGGKVAMKNQDGVTEWHHVSGLPNA